MNIGKVFGKILGKSKKKKVINPENEITSGSEENEPECYQAFSSMGNPCDDSIRSEKKSKRDVPTFRSGSYDFSDQFKLPSANEVRKQLLEAERAHKLWKIRNRLKKYGLAPSKELLAIELDQRGSHKWDYILKLPVVERYFCMIQYIRTLAAKEALTRGYSGNITSETTEEEIDTFHKKFRLDFRLNSKGEPSNVSVGEDSTSTSQSEPEMDVKDTDRQDDVSTGANLFSKEFKDKLASNYESYWEKSTQDFSASASVNVLKEAYLIKKNRIHQSDSMPTSEYETFYSCSSTDESVYEETSDLHQPKITSDSFNRDEEVKDFTLEERYGEIFDFSKQSVSRRLIRIDENKSSDEDIHIEENVDITKKKEK